MRDKITLNPEDDRLVALYRKNRSATLTGRTIGWSRQRVEYRILHLRAQGVKLPPPRPRGYILQDNKEWASKIGRLGYSQGLGKDEDDPRKHP